MQKTGVIAALLMSVTCCAGQKWYNCTSVDGKENPVVVSSCQPDIVSKFQIKDCSWLIGKNKTCIVTVENDTVLEYKEGSNNRLENHIGDRRCSTIHINNPQINVINCTIVIGGQTRNAPTIFTYTLATCFLVLNTELDFQKILYQL